MVWNVREGAIRRIRTEYPHEVRVIEHTWIPMSDGTRLAARIWLPADAAENPVPAILEYIPYRKNDFTAVRDSLRHPYFAGHGYASVRVDIRGSGDSEGILHDEYLAQEQDDALEVLAWLARQPWCTGAVGMIGKSWGGFNGLQVAARRPPQLKAVITLCSTDDRYADDVHYRGGCLMGSDMLYWASTMLVYNARPPDPRFVGDRWRELWFERMEQTPPFVEEWVGHQRRDAYWQHGSVCEDYGAIECPVLAVGGWLDSYRDAVLRLLEGLPGPRKGLIGPWAHEYPEVAEPGPRIGFLQECLRWWDQWLKGKPTGVMDEPMLRVWMQESTPPSTNYPAERAGRWVAEACWPSGRTVPTRYRPRGTALVPVEPAENAPAPAGADLDGTGPGSAAGERENPVRRPGEAAAHTCTTVAAQGLHAGVWCPFGRAGDLPSDQRHEDALALTFTTAPLAAPLEILGNPEVRVELSSDRPFGLVSARLCDVAPDGSSTLVSAGLLNLTHRNGHDTPAPLVPGERYAVTVELDAIAHSLPAGHRWRLALTPHYWPRAWPSPEPVTLTIYEGATELILPGRPANPADEQLEPFEPSETAPVMPVERLRPDYRERTIHHDLVAGEWVLTDASDTGLNRLPDGSEFDTVELDTYRIREGEPQAASVECRRTIRVGNGAWQTRVETRSTMTTDAAAFHLTNELTAFEGDEKVFEKSWTKRVPRDHV